jgi:hypothetical protein
MINNNFNNVKEMMLRLTRIESKLARGFEELGVNINTDRDWLSVDDAARVVYVSTLGRSIMVTLADMAQRGATHTGHTYDIVHRGDVVGTLVFNPPFQNN